MTADPLALMISGEWYCCFDPLLEAERLLTRRAVHQHAMLPPDQRLPCGPMLRDRLGAISATARIEAPFHASYAFNTYIGEAAYLNTGCVILDTARVSIGDHSMLGPGVQIYTADHHRDPDQRRQGIERGLAVSIGSDVWIGGGAIILPGVSIGDGAIVGAGSVVTRDVPPRSRVAGQPARAL